MWYCVQFVKTKLCKTLDRMLSLVVVKSILLKISSDRFKEKMKLNNRFQVAVVWFGKKFNKVTWHGRNSN